MKKEREIVMSQQWGYKEKTTEKQVRERKQVMGETKANQYLPPNL